MLTNLSSFKLSSALLAAVLFTIRPATAAVEISDSSGDDISAYVHTLVGTYKSPGTESAQFAANGPFIGNGDMRAVLLGSWREQVYHISEADMWTDGANRNICQVATGGLTISGAPADKPDNARFIQEQRLWDPNIAARSADNFTTRAVVCATENVMLVDLWTDGKLPIPMTVSLWAKADRKDMPGAAGVQDGLMWATRETRASPRWISRNAMAAKIIGAEPQLVSDGKGQASAKFTLLPWRKVTVIVTLRGGRNAVSPLPEAINRVRDLAFAGTANLLAAHVHWWRQYWAASWLRTYDETWDRVYFGGLYFMACVNRGNTTPAGQYPLCTTDSPGWCGDYHMDQEYMGQYCWGFAGNRPEIVGNVFKPLLDFVPEGKEIAATKMKDVHPSFGPRKGICYPVGLVPGGICSDYFFGNMVSNASYTGQLIIWNYEYYQSLDWLRSTGYPYIRLLGDFWESHLVLENGRYVAYGATWEGMYGRNSLLDLAMARRVLTALITFSEDLGVDAEKRPQWQSIIDRLSDYPTMERNGKRVLACIEGSPRIPDKCEVDALVFPSEIINMGSTGPWKQIVTDTITDGMQRYQVPKMGCDAARLGFPAKEIQAILKPSAITCPPGDWMGMRPNMVIGDFHGTGEFLDFLQACMLQSGGGEVRLFPCQDHSYPAAFHNLRAKGAFLISAEIKGGQIGGVKIFSEKGRDCTMVNPWPHRNVLLVRNGRPAQVFSADRFTFKTEMNENLELKVE